LDCTLTVSGHRTVQEGAENGHDLQEESARSVLLAEDEPLVAMMMEDVLIKLGFNVVGPFGRLIDATAAARKRRFDAAVLDVNLGGELVFPLAQTLAESDTPIIFVTGYGPERIDKRFSSSPVLQKPLQVEALEEVLLKGLCTLPR
jgi:DNA-binding response OmpR family regulator